VCEGVAVNQGVVNRPDAGVGEGEGEGETDVSSPGRKTCSSGGRRA